MRLDSTGIRLAETEAAILGMVLVSGVLDENRSGLPGESTKGMMLGLGAAVI